MLVGKQRVKTSELIQYTQLRASANPEQTAFVKEKLTRQARHLAQRELAVGLVTVTATAWLPQADVGHD